MRTVMVEKREKWETEKELQQNREEGEEDRTDLV